MKKNGLTIKLLPLIMSIMLLIISAFPAFAQETDKSIVSANTAKAVAAIDKSVYKDHNGYRHISFIPFENCVCIIKHTDSCLEFRYIYHLKAKRLMDIAELHLPLPYGASAKVDVTSANTLKQHWIIAETDLAFASYTKGQNSIKFTPKDQSGYDAQTAQNLCNKVFDMAIESWDELLRSETGISMAQLGFTKLCAAKGHKYGSWSTEKPATELSAGRKVHRCTSCGNIESSSIPQLAPTLPAISISKPKAMKKAAKVKWKKISRKDRRRIDKVQIQFSRDKTFTKGVKTVTAKKTAASKKIKKLKRRKTYYIRIRAYSKRGGIEHASAWSKVRSVRAK